VLLGTLAVSERFHRAGSWLWERVRSFALPLSMLNLNNDCMINIDVVYTTC
jgi:hypothetical protein